MECARVVSAVVVVNKEYVNVSSPQPVKSVVTSHSEIKKKLATEVISYTRRKDLKVID